MEEIQSGTAEASSTRVRGAVTELDRKVWAGEGTWVPEGRSRWVFLGREESWRKG